MLRGKVKYGTMGKDPSVRFRQKRSNLEKEAALALEQAMKDGVAIMKNMIETRGIRKPGRIETSKMLNAVGYEFTPGAGKVKGRFGWVNDTEKYFLYQEGGFQHAQAGMWIGGMYAMQDAGDWVLNELRERLKENARGA